MPKVKKTARELADMISPKLSLPGVRFNVLKDSVGWHAVVYGSSPDFVACAQSEIDQVVQNLRVQFDLAE